MAYLFRGVFFHDLCLFLLRSVIRCNLYFSTAIIFVSLLFRVITDGAICTRSLRLCQMVFHIEFGRLDIEYYQSLFV